MLRFDKLHIIISAQVWAYGPAHDLLYFLNTQKTTSVLFMQHETAYKGKQQSGYDLYTHGKLDTPYRQQFSIRWEMLRYIRSFVTSIAYVFKHKHTPWDLYIGCSNLDTFAGLILQKLGIVKDVIYYTIDYNPNRFSNKILNRFFHRLDIFCVRHTKQTWNISANVMQGRKDYQGFSSSKQVVVPNPIWFDRMPDPFTVAKKYTMGFVGHVLKKQGLDETLEAIALVVQKYPTFSFLLMGDGKHLPSLQQKAHILKIEKNVVFAGYMVDQVDLEYKLAECSFAIAMYRKYDSQGNLTFTNFADPMKPKQYLASGLPVILSDVPYFAQDFMDNKCGFVVSNEPVDIANAILRFLDDEQLLKQYQKNARSYSSIRDGYAIYNKIFSGLYKNTSL